MKQALFFIGGILLTIQAGAQTFDEWFRQQETQIRYLADQITALKAYAGVISKGYDLTRNGLSGIFRSRAADFVQHQSFFSSLWKVKPLLQGYGKIASIIQMNQIIASQSASVLSSSDGFLTQQDLSYVNKVYISLLEGCHELADELQVILTDDRIQLTDDERLRRIDDLYHQMRERYQFSSSFLGQIRLLVASRRNEKNEVDAMSSWYGFKKTVNGRK